ncbi:hypothetical protein U1Q18_029357, partial [Sarracenia purpurea var. burkii]
RKNRAKKGRTAKSAYSGSDSCSQSTGRNNSDRLIFALSSYGGRRGTTGALEKEARQERM